MKFVNKYLRNFTPYKLASHKIWSGGKQERENILKLDWNEATIEPSPKVSERIKRIVDEGGFYNLYPSTYNEDVLRLLSEYTKLPQENIQYFASSDSLHEYIAKLYITVGDPVLILGPTYDNFRLTAEVCGADIYFCEYEEDFSFDSGKFINMIEDKEPSLVYMCNPNNPTGNIHRVEFIEGLLKKYPYVLFLIDEAYAEFSGMSAKELVKKYENILISRTMSKAFALANFRFGYLLASKNNVDYISSIRNPKNISTFAQEAVIGALSDVEYMQQYVEEVNVAKKQFREDLQRFEKYFTCVNGEGNFLLIKCKNPDVKCSCISYLEKKDIFVRGLTQTEALRELCFRITIGTCGQMKYVVSILEKWEEEYARV